MTEPRPDPDPGRGGLGSAPVEDALLDPPVQLPPDLRRRLWLLGTDSGIRRFRLGLLALLALGGLAFVAVGANRPADPRLAPETDRTPPAGFGETGFRITPADGPPAEGCAVLAAAPAQWEEGFMNKQALPGYDAMVFEFPEERDGAFFNKNVPIALDIAWYATGGGFVDSATMPPCVDAETCPLFTPRAPYLYAVEAPAGDLARIGASEGSTFELTGACGGG